EFQIAQQGLQECVDAEFDTMEQERKRIRIDMFDLNYLRY
ncbi:13472_t:CDS:1, partial [Funneliformis caledonium]